MASKGIFVLDFAGDLGKEAPPFHLFWRDNHTKARCSLLFACKGMPMNETGAQGLRDRRARVGFLENFWVFFVPFDVSPLY